MNNCSHVNSTNITFSVNNRPIHKDQCLRCFDDQKSQNGLDICLKCFSGNCKNEFFNHSSLHYEQKNHPLVLNMKQVKIINQTSIEDKKITKLAIGKPGGADFSNENWELWTSVYCHACKVQIDFSENKQLSDLITSIINTASANEQSSISAWEEEILPCEHTLLLNQAENIKIPPKYNATCSDCSLSSNLWLCLTCGNLGCGRKNYDGTGGNNHGIEHFEKCKHPLVVKTGTITPNGDASVYCYACNNDVKDPELAKHLIHFGIDISEQKKTEKTMTELNLEINLNFTLSKQIEDGKVLTPIYGAGFTGLENLGNSCYMNSVIQILFSLETFLEKYLDNALIHLNNCTNEPHECITCQVSKVMYGMHSGMYSNKLTRELPLTEDGKIEIEEYQQGIKPSSFKTLIGKDHPEFSTNKQQDAFEYMSHLLDKFEKYEKTIGQLPSLRSFEFDLESRLECLECQSVKYRTQRNWYLPLSIPGWQQKDIEGSAVSWDECLSKFLGQENVELSCGLCKKQTVFAKTQRIANFPKYLVIMLERFVYDWVPKKLEIPFVFPTDNVNIGLLARQHSKTGEKVIEDSQDNIEESEKDIEFNQADLNLLINNGVPELAAKHALHNTNHNVDMALMWFYEHLEDSSINGPLPKIKAKSKGEKKFNEEDVATLISFGFNRNQAEGTLKKYNNNIELCANHLFNNPNEVFEEEGNDKGLEEINKNRGSAYNLYGFITHLGKNTSHGHYVSHVRKNGQWIYYNDSKVTVSQEPPFQKGYIYIFANNQ